MATYEVVSPSVQKTGGKARIKLAYTTTVTSTQVTVSATAYYQLYVNAANTAVTIYSESGGGGLPGLYVLVEGDAGVSTTLSKTYTVATAKTWVTVKSASTSHAVARTKSDQAKRLYAFESGYFNQLPLCEVPDGGARVTVPVLPSYSVTLNGNGSSYTKTLKKWHGEALAINHVPSTGRTGYTFANAWTSEPSGGTSYANGYSYTANAAKTFYAKWTPNTYHVRFDGNSPQATGTMADQAFAYGTAKALSAVAFSRADHAFAGWAKSMFGQVAYANQQSVSNLASSNGATVALYAVWEQTYFQPSIAMAPVVRCDVDGTPDDEGTYVLVRFDWSVSTAEHPDNVGSTAQASLVGPSSTPVQTASFALSGASGTEEAALGPLPIDMAGTVHVAVTDTHDVPAGGLPGTATAQATVSTTAYPIDVAYDEEAGKYSVGILSVAPQHGVYVGSDVEVAGGLGVEGAAVVGELSVDGPADLLVQHEAGAWNTARFGPYSQDAPDIDCYRVANVVTVVATATPTVTIPGNANAAIVGYVPSGFAPRRNVYAVAPGSGRRIWNALVRPNGEVVLSRYGTTTGFEDIGPGTWLPFYMTYVV